MIQAFQLSPRGMSVAMAAAMVLAGCSTVGPDYQRPNTVADGPASFARAPASPNEGAPLAAWWRLLKDPALDALIDEVLAHNPTLAATQAKLRQSRAHLAQKESSKYPSVGLDTLVLEEVSAPGTAQQQTSQSTYVLGFDASWELDLFGGHQRATEAAQADAEAAVAELADAQVSLSAEVASTYLGLRTEQLSLQQARQAQQLDLQQLALVQQRVGLGVATTLDLERATARVDSDQSEILGKQENLRDASDRLAFLVGLAPAQLDQRLQVLAANELPQLPETLSIGHPDALLKNRPDIRAAERRLASNTAQIGEKQANRFPKIKFMGDLGLMGSTPSQLMHWTSATLLGLPMLQWNVLDFGRSQAQVNQAEAARDEALARYQASVLSALHDANNSLARYGHQREQLMHQLTQQASAVHLLELTQQRRAAGVTTEMDVQDARRELMNRDQDVLAARGQLLKQFVSVNKSLGLGWQLPG